MKNLSEKAQTFLKTLENQYKKFKEEKKDEVLQILVFAERRFVVYHLENLIENFYKNQARIGIKGGHIIGFSKAESCSKKYSDIMNEINNLGTSLQEQENKAFEYYKGANYAPQILPSCFQQSNKFSHINVNLDAQLKTIEDFKKKNLNLLVATSVAEEGFDMPECNLVIAFNEIKSIQSFIQIKGRARKKNSKFLIMTPIHKKKEMKERIVNFISAIQIMKDIAEEIARFGSVSAYEESIRRFSQARARTIVNKDEAYKKIKIKHPVEENGEVRESLLNTNWSKVVLSDYCNSLRKVIRGRYESKGQMKELEDDANNRANFSINFRPIYVIHHTPAMGYLCHIIMPLNSNTRVFVSRGEMMKNREDAKKYASFELVKYLYKREKAFYCDLRPNARTFRVEDDDNVEELITLEEKKEDMLMKKKIQRFKQIYKKKVKNLRYYFYLTNEIFYPKFLLENQNPRFYFYLVEFFDQHNTQIGKNSNYQLGFLYFGEAFELEIGKGRIIEDNSLKIKMTIRYLTRCFEISEEIFTLMKKIDAFLWSAINNDDLNFFNIYSGEGVDVNGFFNGFIKKKHEKTKYIPYGFDFSQEYMMIVILNKKEPCLLAAEKYKEILIFLEEMKEHYNFFNSLKKKIDNKEKIQKKSINMTFF